MTTNLIRSAWEFCSARKALFVVALLLVLLLVVLLLTERITRNAEVERQRAGAMESISVYAGNLSGELDKYSSLPFMLARHPQFNELLQNPVDPNQVDAANRLLAEFNSISQALDIYVLDAKGITRASSNWNSETSFIGEDLSFRPYFQDAMTSGSGYYFALGSTSKKRGFYFSAPVQDKQTNSGVLVVKVNLDRVEKILSAVNRRIAITDPEGVIFVSNEADWVYRTMDQLEEEKLESLYASRRYADHPLEPLPINSKPQQPRSIFASYPSSS